MTTLRLVHVIDPASLSIAELIATAERIGITPNNVADEATGLPEACRRAEKRNWPTDPVAQAAAVVQQLGRLMRDPARMPLRLAVARLLVDYAQAGLIEGIPRIRARTPGTGHPDG